MSSSGEACPSDVDVPVLYVSSELGELIVCDLGLSNTQRSMFNVLSILDMLD